MFQLRKSLASTVLAAGLGLALTLPAHAGVSFTTGNHPQADEDNVLLKSGATGSTVSGLTNSGGLLVDFSSKTDTLTEPSSGQARVGASDGAVNDLTITVPGGDYIDLIMNPFLEDSDPGSAVVTVVTNVATYTFNYDLDNGNNFLTIVADGEKISSTNIESEGGFGDLRQPRISGAEIGDPSEMPEPCTLALLGLGALPLAARRRRRQA